jgi:hypothetical protein
MPYKQKVLILSIVVAALALIYAGTLILTPERLNSRNAAYTWLESKWADQADRIEISKAGETLSLVRRNDLWYVEKDNAEYPAKQGRVEDLLRALTTRAAYPVQSSAPSSHERLGLSEEAASRVLVRGGAGTPLLDLLVGGGSATGREVYLRKSGQNEARSGEDKFTAYLSPSPAAWYNLRLFPEAPAFDMVQGVTVISPSGAPAGEAGEEPAPPAAPLVITRSGPLWTLEGTARDALDATRIDSYIRAILDAEGDNFVTGMKPGDLASGEGSIHLELGDGTSRTIRLGPVLPAGEENGTGGNRVAVVSGSPYVYTLAEWTVNRLFQNASYFNVSSAE